MISYEENIKILKAWYSINAYWQELRKTHEWLGVGPELCFTDHYYQIYANSENTDRLKSFDQDAILKCVIWGIENASWKFVGSTSGCEIENNYTKILDRTPERKEHLKTWKQRIKSRVEQCEEIMLYVIKQGESEITNDHQVNS